MPRICVVSESAKAVLKSERMTIGRFLWQVGRRTWMGQLSEEGIQLLIELLSKKATKSSQIIIWNVGKNPAAVIFRLGHCQRFNERGHFAWKKLKKSSYAVEAEQSEYKAAETGHSQNLLKGVLQLAALFHDLGKGTVGFQKKLSATSPEEMCDPVRHEVISCWLVERLLDWACDRAGGQETPWIGFQKALLLLSEATEQDRTQWQELLERELSERKPNATGKGFRPFSSFQGWAEKIRGMHTGQGTSSDSEIYGPREWLLWLVLSHHRLPSGYSWRELKQQRNPDPNWRLTHGDGIANMINAINYADYDSQPPDREKYRKRWEKINGKDKGTSEYRTLAQGCQPWQDAEWLEALRVCCASLADAFSKCNESDGRNFGRLIAMVCRPLLILSDYEASARKQRQEPSPEQLRGMVFANTIREGADVYWADTLPRHLTRAGEQTERYWNWTATVMGNKMPAGLEGLSHAASDCIKTDLLPRFAWQSALPLFRKRLVADHGPQKIPTFTSMIAGTGSGKTLGIFNAMVALATMEKTRYSLGLGLRTLARQTYGAYTTPLKKGGLLGLSTSQCLVMIGDAFSRRQAELMSLADLETKAADDNLKKVKETLLVGEREWSGSGNEPSALSVMESLIASEGGVWSDEKANGNAFGFEAIGAEVQNVLATPVVVATTDHFVAGAECIHGTSSPYLLRLISTDLALDEVDSYSPSDLVSLGRLVFLCGVAGRSLVLSSATVPCLTVRMFFRIWKEGILAGQLLRKKPIQKFGVALSSEVAHCCQMKVIDIATDEQLWCSHGKGKTQEKWSETDFFNSLYAFHVAEQEAISNRIASERFFARRDVHFVKLTKTGRKEKFDTVFKECLNLHDKQKQECKISEREVKFSVGFVRWNTVPCAQSFALYLDTQASTQSAVSVAVICYHARMSRLDRSQLEEKLDAGLKRDNKGNLPLLASSEIEDWISASQASEFALIISTTSVEETGRDHDVDWAVLDPNSWRSLVQAAGRVRRHRSNGIWKDDHCVGLLSYPSQEWFSKSEGSIKSKDIAENINHPWSFPGVGNNTDIVLLPPNKILKNEDPKAPVKKNPIVSSLDPELSKVWESTCQASHERSKSMIVAKMESSTSAFLGREAQKIENLLAEPCLITPENLESSPLQFYTLLNDVFYLSSHADAKRVNSFSWGGLHHTNVGQLFLSSYESSAFRDSEGNETVQWRVFPEKTNWTLFPNSEKMERKVSKIEGIALLLKKVTFLSRFLYTQDSSREKWGSDVAAIMDKMKLNLDSESPEGCDPNSPIGRKAEAVRMSLATVPVPKKINVLFEKYSVPCKCADFDAIGFSDGNSVDSLVFYHRSLGLVLVKFPDGMSSLSGVRVDELWQYIG